MTGVVYVIRNLVTGKEYVGITTASIRSRWYGHVHRARRRRSPSALSYAIRKYGPEAFSIETIEKIDGSLEELRAAEVAHIAARGTVSPGGYNLTPGGDLAPIPEACERLSAAMRASCATAERRAQMSEAGKRWHRNEVSRRAFDDGIERRALNAVWRANVSASARRRAANPEWKAKQLERSRALAKDPAWVAKMAVVRRKLAADPEWKRRNAERLVLARQAKATTARPVGEVGQSERKQPTRRRRS